MTVFKCMGDNCEECPFDDCRRPDNKVENGEVTIRPPINQYDRNTGRKIAQYANAKEASLATGVRHEEISLCVNKKRRSAKGYFWEYA